MNQNSIMMPFVKYAQTHLKILIHDEKRNIKGVFRNKKTRQIVKGDNFLAVVCGKGTPEETYKAYIDWYNYTREDYKKEAERELVSAEWDKEAEARTTPSKG